MVRLSTGQFRRALVVENPHPSLDERLAAHGIEAVRLGKVLDDHALIDAINHVDADLLFKRSRVAVSREVVEACPSLRAVQLCCIGDDSVDKEACADHGVLVFNDPISNGRSVVELAVGHMITLSRRVFEADALTRGHQWDKTNTGRFEVKGKVLGIVGLGNIGRQVARVAEALGVTVQFFDSRSVAQEVGYEMGWRQCDGLVDVFRTSDIVTVHTSARDHRGRDNADLLDGVLSQLAADRPEPSPRIFLNLARGNLHSAEALIDAVGSGAIRRAAIDVYPVEPSPGVASWVNPYAGDHRIVCSPHIGAATQEAQPRIARRVAQTMHELSAYGSVRDCVFSPRAKLTVKDSARGRVVLSVIHSTARGTKKAVDDAIYEAEANNLGSEHRDFPVGIAVDLSVLDRPLTAQQLERLVERARDLAQDATAIRAVRQIEVPA